MAADFIEEIEQLTIHQNTVDSPLQSAIRAGNLELVLEIISQSPEDELKELLSKQNNSFETALYVAAENGHNF